MHKTKRQIFEKSMELFANKGYDSTSIEEITSVVGIAKGTFYYHFPKKEDIFYFLIEEGMNLLRNSIEIKTKNIENSVEKIRAIILIQIKVTMEYEHFIRFILGQMWGTEERNKMCKKCIEDYIDIIEKIVIEGIEKGQIKKGDSKIIAYGIYSVICSCLMYKGKEEKTIKELHEQYWEYILNILK